jgi:hypothetical protein
MKLQSSRLEKKLGCISKLDTEGKLWSYGKESENKAKTIPVTGSSCA